jgi:hydrogenase expression/formation protein HypC
MDDLMCLGVPGLVVDVSADGLVATVDVFGVRRVVRLELVGSRVSAGDYVLNHVGYAIRRIPDDNIAETLTLYRQLLRGVSDDEDEDLMAVGAGSEIAAAGEDRDD